MDVVAHKVAQTVGHEQRPQADLHHFVNWSLDQADFDQFFKMDAVGQQVHVDPGHSWNEKFNLYAIK